MRGLGPRRALRLLAAGLLVFGLTGLSPQPASAQAQLADLVEQVAPSVVNLHTSGTRQSMSDWGVFLGPQPWSSLGSGFVVSEGLVVTNQHVVGPADEILVMDHRGRVFEAERIAADAAIDLALLRVPGLDLPVVELGSSSALRVGDDVFAVGNPYGHGHTVTRGILSARSRSIGRQEFDLFLQTDAAINPGSSGGPLFDMQGRVIGVNTAIDGRGESIGFAMPVELVLGALPVLEKGEPVQPGWVGLRLDEVRGGALRVASVYADGPADRAGLEAGDRILSVNGRLVHGRVGWVESFGLAFPGEERTLLVSRGERELVRRLTLGSRSEWAARVSGPVVPIEELAIEVRGIAPDVAEQLGVSAGLQVVSAGRGAFFRTGDVILEFSGRPTQRPAELQALASEAARRRSLDAVVYRGGTAFRIARRW